MYPLYLNSTSKYTMMSMLQYHDKNSMFNKFCDLQKMIFLYKNNFPTHAVVFWQKIAIIPTISLN